jgi:hypothetical protein
MEAVGTRVTIAITTSKKRTVYRECTVYEYVAESYDIDGNKSTYWKCFDDTGDSTFDWSDIIAGRVHFSN